MSDSREWRTVAGFDGLYRISDDGRVQTCSMPGGRSRGEWRELKLSETKRNAGYITVNLWDAARKSTAPRLVHQLVAHAFLAADPDRPCVNHIDGNKKNNRASNLEWCTRSENLQHAWRTGLCRPHKLTAEKAREIRLCGGTDTATAQRFGVSQVLVTKIRAGKVWRGA